MQYSIVYRPHSKTIKTAKRCGAHDETYSEKISIQTSTTSFYDVMCCGGARSSSRKRYIMKSSAKKIAHIMRSYTVRVHKIFSKRSKISKSHIYIFAQMYMVGATKMFQRTAFNRIFFFEYLKKTELFLGDTVSYERMHILRVTINYVHLTVVVFLY